MTTKVRNMTGITIDWDDQDWETTLRQQNSNMDFLFDTSLESILESAAYREAYIDVAVSWCQWVLDNTNETDANDVELYDVVVAAQWIVDNSDCFSSDETVRNAAIAVLIQSDIDFEGSTLIYQNEYLREKINTFWIEYIYQLKGADNTSGLSLISHT